MKIKIKRIDKSLPIPEYKTEGAVAFDLSSRIDIEIGPGEIGYIPLNVVVKVPKGNFLLLAPRSSTHKMGLVAANSIGIIDNDYCGEEDEIKFAALNYTDKAVKIEKGTRVAQMLVLNIDKAEIEEVEKMEDKSRGGFGTTGNI